MGNINLLSFKSIINIYVIIFRCWLLEVTSVILHELLNVGLNHHEALINQFHTLECTKKKDLKENF